MGKERRKGSVWLGENLALLTKKNKKGSSKETLDSETNVENLKTMESFEADWMHLFIMRFPGVNWIRGMT